MSDEKQLMIDEKIRKKEEELKCLRAKKADLKRKEQKRKKQEKERWFRMLNEKLELILKEIFGEGYQGRISQDEIARIIKDSLEMERGDSDESGCGYEDC